MSNISNINGKPFGSSIDSARNYMLEILKEKYGEDFQIVGDEKLTDYPLHGAVYGCSAAPISDSNNVFTALIDQSKPDKVRDDFAKYFFKEEAETASIALCEKKEYVTAYQIEFMSSATERKWSAQDGLQTFLAENNARVEIYAQLTDNKTDEQYAEMIADFIKDIYNSSVNISLDFVNNERYVFFSNFSAKEDNKSPQLTIDEILAIIEYAKESDFYKQDDLIIK